MVLHWESSPFLSTGMESTSLWKPVFCRAWTNQDALDQNGFKHKERMKNAHPGGADQEITAEPCISAPAECSCGLLVTWAFLPFWADEVWIDLVADVLIGSSKVGQALIVAIRHWESKQKRGSDGKCSLFGGQEQLPRAACVPLVQINYFFWSTPKTGWCSVVFR